MIEPRHSSSSVFFACVAMVAWFAAIPAIGGSVTNSLPYRDGFESADLGSASGAWRGMTNYGEVTVQASDYIEGSKALTLSTGSVHVAISDSKATNVWVQIYSKLQPYVADPPPPLASGQVAGFLVTTNGALKAWSNNTWIICSTIPSVATNAWMGFAVHLDYNAGEYDLYVSTNASFGTHMKRAHGGPLKFNGSASELTRIVITNKTTDPGYVDLIAASYAHSAVGVADMTNLVASDRLAGHENQTSIPPYNYSDTENTLASLLGTNLMLELAHDDTITISSNGLNVYRYGTNAPAPSWQFMDGVPIDTMHISESMGFTITRGAGVDAVAFYPYSNVLASVTNVFLTGTNTPIVLEGWNQVATHFATPTRPADFEFSSQLNNNDKLFYPDGEWIWWDATAEVWKRMGVAATRTLSEDVVWFYHRGTGIVWQVR